MVYPFDLVSGSELNDKALTEHGFRLDMARSKYLNIDVKRYQVSASANGYKEDLRFNRPAKDGDEYTEEGIYRFEVKNLYTGEVSSKTIYVGNADYLRALSVNQMTVEELNARLKQGEIVMPDGSLKKP